MNIYSGKITSLPNNGIFVFGSNTQGRHGKGSALYAIKKFGAIYGQAYGLQGKSYAIVTKDLTKKGINPTISVEIITNQIKDLYDYANLNPDKLFYVAYSSTGVNLNGYNNDQMALMFGSYKIPDNIVFEEGFSELIKQSYIK